MKSSIFFVAMAILFQQPHKLDTFKLYYFPMYANTYEAIDVEAEFDLSSLAKGHDGDLLKILSRHDERSVRFDDKQVRVEAAWSDGRTIRVDLHHNVSFGKATYRLSATSYRELYRTICDLLPEDMTAKTGK